MTLLDIVNFLKMSESTRFINHMDCPVRLDIFRLIYILFVHTELKQKINH